MVDQRRIDDQRWVGAREAARRLGIDIRTLYAYVSRGQVRSVAAPRGRARLYALEDLERLRTRRDARAGHGAVAAGALRWGEPVLDSAITAITSDGPVYRGQPAVALAARGTAFEDVAELLWSGALPAAPVRWPRRALPLAPLARLIPPGGGVLAQLALVVSASALADRDRDDARPDMMVARGRELLPVLAASLAPDLAAAAVSRALGAPTVATIAARALDLDDAVAPVLEVAMILLADHELNASSFTARIAASTGAGPYACVAAALATLSGPHHGSASEAVVRFAAEVGAPEAARAAVRALRRRGEVPPGCGQPLYPGGDPRAAPLLALAREHARSRRARTLLAIADACTDVHPNSDLGLAALFAALGAPAAAAPGLFAVARCAGWIAHALEQRASGARLRPRARYVGIAPPR